MDKIKLIIGREYWTRVKKKSFIIMTILGPILFVGFMAGAIYLGVNDSKTYDLVLTDQEGIFGVVIEKTDFEDSSQINYHFHDGSMSDEEFKESPYDLKIDLNEALLRTTKVNMYYKEQPGAIVTGNISNALEKSFERAKLQKNNIDRELYESITTPIGIVKFDIDNVDKNTDSETGAMVGFVMSIMIFIFVFMYGAQIMRGVMEEKTSRIVEVIVSSVKPFQLMLGKIIGVALVGLTQFLLWVILSGVLYSVAGVVLGDAYGDPSALVDQQMSADAMSEVMSEMKVDENPVAILFKLMHQVNWVFLIGMFLFYFIGGYLMYGALFAAVGSAVDSETDSQQFMMPMIMPLMFGYIVSSMAFTNPASSVIYWCSIIPFTSPVVMMVRVGSMALGYEPIDWLSIGLSMALLIGGFLFTVWLAGRIYRVGILMYGKKVGYKELWKWVRYY